MNNSNVIHFNGRILRRKIVTTQQLPFKPISSLKNAHLNPRKIYVKQ